jgi:hypothetical protein
VRTSPSGGKLVSVRGMSTISDVRFCSDRRLFATSVSPLTGWIADH